MGIDVDRSVFTTGSKYNDYSKKCVHFGKGNPSWKSVSADITIDGNTGINIGLSSAGEYENPETIPSHDRVAVMVYVGGRKKEYKRIYDRGA